jgi:hypothetical protein
MLTSSVEDLKKAKKHSDVIGRRPEKGKKHADVIGRRPGADVRITILCFFAANFRRKKRRFS